MELEGFVKNNNIAIQSHDDLCKNMMIDDRLYFMAQRAKEIDTTVENLSEIEFRIFKTTLYDKGLLVRWQELLNDVNKELNDLRIVYE